MAEGGDNRLIQGIRRAWALVGGRGAAFAAGPGFERLLAPPFREASNRDPGDALKVLLEAAPKR